jgi:hypothetical protein
MRHNKKFLPSSLNSGRCSLNLPNISFTPISTEFYSVWRFLAAPILFAVLHYIIEVRIRTFKLHEKPLTLKRELPALLKNEILKTFFFFWVLFPS